MTENVGRVKAIVSVGAALWVASAVDVWAEPGSARSGSSPSETMQVGPVAATSAVVPDAVNFLRHALIQANRSGLYSVPPSWVVLGSLTRLELVGSGSGRRLECEVSLVLVDRRGGQLRAIATGRAAEGGGERSFQRVLRWQRHAIEGAAAQAMGRLMGMVRGASHASR